MALQSAHLGPEKSFWLKGCCKWRLCPHPTAALKKKTLSINYKQFHLLAQTYYYWFYNLNKPISINLYFVTWLHGVSCSVVHLAAHWHLPRLCPSLSLCVSVWLSRLAPSCLTVDQISGFMTVRYIHSILSSHTLNQNQLSYIPMINSLFMIKFVALWNNTSFLWA